MKLKELRKSKNLNQCEVASYLGITSQAYGNYESGRRQPDPETLKKLADFFEVSVDYLLERSNRKSFDEVNLSSYNNIFPVITHRIPLLGDIACGQPIYANEEHESYIQAGTTMKADFCLKCKGDSMINARINDGDIVFVRQQDMVDNGEIAVVLIGEEATLKRVYYYPDKAKLVLNPENPAYEPFVYIGAELNEIKIIGKAIAFQSDVK